MVGCESTGTPWSGSSAKSADENDHAKTETTAQAKGSKPQVVTDSSKVVEGEGQHVKGINDWEGEISGVPAANSKFKRLKIGMSMKQVTDLIGEPSDQGAYITGKAWIPFYFGSDRNRFEYVYKNQGRLIFAGGGLGDLTSGHLIWIIHNAREPGYRE
ncbi:MAG: hypothetical protein P4L70_07130 [Parasulfuritortus sp.]|jgi:hypothetical protein|nr:hypothetical protein [Parasulfuritortus sp.]